MPSSSIDRLQRNHSWLEAKNMYASPAELLRMANNIPLRALQYADDEALQDRTVLHGVMEKLSGEMDISLAAKSCEDFSLQDNIEGMLLCTSRYLAHVQAISEITSLLFMIMIYSILLNISKVVLHCRHYMSFTANCCRPKEQR